jgi:hypothetical protein
MPRTIRFHLDENCDPAIAAGLRRQGIDVTTAHDSCTRAIEEHVGYAFRDNRVVFTQDRDFLRLHAAGTPHRGIAYCKKDTLGIGEIINGLMLIWEIYDPEEMVGRIEYL